MLVIVILTCCRAPETVYSSTSSVKATAKSDMWSLGCILLEMYMGSTWPSAAEAAKLFTVGPYSGPLPAALGAAGPGSSCSETVCSAAVSVRVCEV